MDGNVRIGTSGWMYKDWSKGFYPPALPKKEMLGYLASHFPTVEVNSSFYHLPLQSTFAKWAAETPDDFLFAVKLSRFITHQKRLRGIRGAMGRFLRHARPLQAKLGAVLIQLPPSLVYEEKRLLRLISDLQSMNERIYPVAYALEPRHRSWMAKDALQPVREYCREAGLALVLAQSSAIASFEPIEENLTAELVYIRFHGPAAFAASRYGAARLRPWADRFALWRERGHRILAYFNNDVHGHAIFDAQTLIRQMSRRR